MSVIGAQVRATGALLFACAVGCLFSPTLLAMTPHTAFNDRSLAERKERIGPVHWELLHLEQIKQGKAAVKIQKVFRGFMGRFRAKIVKMQYNLVRLPLDLAARKIQSGCVSPTIHFVS